MELKKVAEKAVDLRARALKLVSKNTRIGKALLTYFPLAIKTLLSSSFLQTGIIAEFNLNIYLNGAFLLSFLFVAVFSFFSESLFETDEELENYVKEKIFFSLNKIFN